MNVCAARTFNEARADLGISKTSVDVLNILLLKPWLPHEPESDERMAMRVAGLHYGVFNTPMVYATCRHCRGVYKEEKA